MYQFSFLVHLVSCKAAHCLVIVSPPHCCFLIRPSLARYAHFYLMWGPNLRYRLLPKDLNLDFWGLAWIHYPRFDSQFDILQLFVICPNLWNTELNQSIKLVSSCALLSFPRQVFSSSRGMTHWGLFIFLFFPGNLLTSFPVSLRPVLYTDSFKSFNRFFPS